VLLLDQEVEIHNKWPAVITCKKKVGRRNLPSLALLGNLESFNLDIYIHFYLLYFIFILFGAEIDSLYI
jgi:hypothetical protein